MIVLIDNFDSFVHNLARYFQLLGHKTRVIRNDAIDVAGVRAARPAAVVFSPGPCTPEESGCSLELVAELHSEFPMLGICLGHQAIAAAFGAKIARGMPVHGRTSRVYHDGKGMFHALPNPIEAGRYHSLVVSGDKLPGCLEVTARTDDGVIMGIRHRKHAVIGLQFHPESILTEYGYAILAGFLRVAGLRTPPRMPSMMDERPKNEVSAPVAYNGPVTF